MRPTKHPASSARHYQAWSRRYRAGEWLDLVTSAYVDADVQVVQRLEADGQQQNGKMAGGGRGGAYSRLARLRRSTKTPRVPRGTKHYFIGALVAAHGHPIRPFLEKKVVQSHDVLILQKM